jgi:hypothetical protein
MRLCSGCLAEFSSAAAFRVREGSRISRTPPSCGLISPAKGARVDVGAPHRTGQNSSTDKETKHEDDNRYPGGSDSAFERPG